MPRGDRSDEDMGNAASLILQVCEDPKQRFWHQRLVSGNGQKGQINWLCMRGIAYL